MTITRRTLRHWCEAFDQPRGFRLRFDVLSLELAAPAETGADGRGPMASGAPGRST